MTRAVVSVATTPYFRRGQARLEEAVHLKHGAGAMVIPYGCGPWLGTTIKGAGEWPLPRDWPTHQDKPFAFKAYALKQAAEAFDYDCSLLWCDACMLPVRSLEPVWAHIEKYGALFMNNGFSNYEWTADSAYPDLFPRQGIEAARACNRHIPHTVGGFFGLNLRHDTGRAILSEFYRLASETRAFCGPTTNTPETPCGPPDVKGSRHDQTVLSVLALRHGVDLVDPPKFFIYGRAQDAQDERTVCVADGSYT